MPSAGNLVAKSANVCRSSGRTVVVVPLTVLSTVTSITEPIALVKSPPKLKTLPSVCFDAKGTLGESGPPSTAAIAA